MKSKLIVLLVSGWATSCLAIVNGDFEAGLSGWTRFTGGGQFYIQDQPVEFHPDPQFYDAYGFSTVDTRTVDGGPALFIDTNGSQSRVVQGPDGAYYTFLTDGASRIFWVGVSQDIYLQAGQMLSGWSRLATWEVSSAYHDHLEVTVDETAVQTITLSDIWWSFVDPAFQVCDCGDKSLASAAGDWTAWQFTAPVSKVYRLKLTVFQDDIINTWAFFRDIEVSSPSPQVTSLSLETSCAYWHAPQATLAARLNVADEPLPGRPIEFAIEGSPLGVGVTGADGWATLVIDPSRWHVGEYEVSARFAGEGSYERSSATKSFGVQYKFVGFQSPLPDFRLRANNGKMIPVKVRLADYFDTPVSTGVARVLYAPSKGGQWAQALAAHRNTGSLMKPEGNSGRYSFDWDISALSGAYSLGIDLGTGDSCGAIPSVEVTIPREGK